MSRRARAPRGPRSNRVRPAVRERVEGRLADLEAREARRPPRVDVDPMRCPRPDKRHHGSERAAQEHADSLREEDGLVRAVYACRCAGGWCVGRT